ncbi:hypothetical protein V3N99_09625 [Dermatophilaceae bacterium Soc4.6]
MSGATSRAATTSGSQESPGHAALMARALTALSIVTGLVWLTNGVATLIGRATYDLGSLSFILVSRGVA